MPCPSQTQTAHSGIPQTMANLMNRVVKFWNDILQMDCKINGVRPHPECGFWNLKWNYGKGLTNSYF